MSVSSNSERRSLVESTSYQDVIERFKWSDLWDLFGGNAESLNIANECLDRHREAGAAVNLRKSDGTYEVLTFTDLSMWTSRFAHYLDEIGVQGGEAVAVMLEPSLGFYTALFGAIKHGAAAVPLFPLFGPDAIRMRLNDCRAKVLVVGAERSDLAGLIDGINVIVLNDSLLGGLARFPSEYQASTRADDIAVLQYTSGTSRQLPEAVRHSHRAIVTVMIAALFGVGLKPADKYFCPSSPAWGHGLWHGTIAPWALGIGTGAYAGRFAPISLVDCLRHFEIDNLAAAGTVYRMMLRDGVLQYAPRLKKASYTGESLDAKTLAILHDELATPVCGMYGTTETGVIVANFPGFEDYEGRLGALGKPVPGWEVAVLDAQENPVESGTTGEICVRRRGSWFRSKDLARWDEDGYLWYLGRADDIIISAGWTISPIEVENALVQHQDVIEAAVVGVPDPVRGQVLKAFVVSRGLAPNLESELKDLVRTKLSPHEYPRYVEFVTELPKTTSGKVNRRELRARYSPSELEP